MPKAESYVEINGIKIDNNNKSKLSNAFETKLLKFTCLNNIKHKLNLPRKPTSIWRNNYAQGVESANSTQKKQ